MVNSNNLFKKKSGEKASDIAIRCFVAIIILNIIMASLAILIPDNSLTLAKLYATFALFLLPALITIGNLRYIEQYNRPVKIFSWASIIGSILTVLCGIIFLWISGTVSAISTVNDIPSSNSSGYSTLETRSSNYLTEEYDDYNYLTEEYDDYDYDNDDDYYSNSYKTYNNYNDYDYTPSTYGNTRTLSIADFIPIIPKIYLISSIVMISTFFIASCLKYKNYSPSIMGLKITSIICISYCCLVAISFLLFPVPLNEMAARFAILALVLINGGFYSWLALVIIAHNEKRKASNETIEDVQIKTPIETTENDAQTISKPTPVDLSTTPGPTLAETPTETPAEAPTAPEPTESVTQPTPEPGLSGPEPTPEA